MLQHIEEIATADMSIYPNEELPARFNVRESYVPSIEDKVFQEITTISCEHYVASYVLTDDFRSGLVRTVSNINVTWLDENSTSVFCIEGIKVEDTSVFCMRQALVEWLDDQI